MTLAEVTMAATREIQFEREVRFEGCDHAITIPLLHSAGHVNCFLCQPELLDRPLKGKFPACRAAQEI